MKKIIVLFLAITCFSSIIGCNYNQVDDNKVMSAIEIETLEIERSYYAFIEELLDKLANSLTYPDSLTVKGVIIEDFSANPGAPFEDTVEVFVKYSSKNRFGNWFDHHAVLSNCEGSEISKGGSLETLYNAYHKICMGRNDSYIHIARNYYKHDLLGIVFMLDLNDYNQQGYSK